ncbi:protein of unknown function DUF1653 [Aequoribacter fuscus]|jgi:hypothetical protein|uniref:Uncharacterized protein n=1 Tax=Aequoribacter fuscus TaxID=2518989 RepID=F3L2X4_9GAMM|nr:DUF1653 domain-containing protein [Aequoribacter fuscus]EGG29325.1 protein of unknown function DUF1653 [Aequoribacter fuscus]QHJ87859.1 DUF1653 domain-containing protein [Aequoribacter fuscus]
MSIPLGYYEHYKGPRYHVIGVARHSETEEEFVVYRTCYGDESLWVRPLSMFSELVETPEGKIPRFRFLDTQDAS